MTLSSDSGAGRKRGNKWAIGAGLGLASVLPLVAFFFGGQLIRIATNQGQIVIEVDDPTITLKVKEDQVVIHDGQGQAEITLAAGDHQLEVTVKQASSEAKFKTDKFTLRRGDRKVFEAREELAKAVASLTPTAPRRPKPDQSQRLRMSQSLGLRFLLPIWTAVPRRGFCPGAAR